MKVEDLLKVYMDKKDVPCPITNKLIDAGYMQTSGGYIDYAKEQNIDKKDITQWWHLIKSYCENRKPDTEFTKIITCGELYVWMYEVLADEKEKEELSRLVDDIIASRFYRNSNTPIYDRIHWNRVIVDKYYDKIKSKVDKEVKKYGN